ncbi:aminotransferase class III-fold pyridoxal phosphate-dependent enzyme [Chitinibacter sp. FCG-7]|uniref:Aminotransferase class III-fold pyridoxal phosphate-dependent enzyme n=1 Tax=Chitinibacter mangrovi TaxID=3153927 RepID=A0AAU7FBK2_9NEIS
MSERYHCSEEMLERALKSIPLGSQTFSKSKTQYPIGVSPFFLTKGQGCYVWDVDGNKYLDMISALASITLGYSDPDVTRAVQDQLNDGVIFSLPHPIEIEVAERICAMVPCAERVRFGKNGSDATAGAIRLARAYTGRDRVAVCGYHGWQDWYIGSTTRSLGVPEQVRSLTHPFPYNDSSALEVLLNSHQHEFAAVILEPMNVIQPLEGYLAEVKNLAHQHGALLIFDETITGFRFDNGGAQTLFGVTPDLATFGKGLANGFPLSAIVGRAEIMQLMEEIFFSFTFGGEALSLAAAKATLEKLQKEPVLSIIKERGERLLDALQTMIHRHKLESWLSLSGYPVWSFLLFKDMDPYTQWDIKTFFMQEMQARGVLTLGTHNLNYAHTAENLDYLLSVYEVVLPKIDKAIREKNLHSQLNCKTLTPLFKIR